MKDGINSEKRCSRNIIGTRHSLAPAGGNTGSASLGAHLHYEVIKTTHSPFSQQFFGNIGERYAPVDLSRLLGN